MAKPMKPPPGAKTSVADFHDSHHDKSIAKAADKRLSNASAALNSVHPILHPIQFSKASRERNKAVLHSREYGSGAKYIDPHPKV